MILWPNVSKKLLTDTATLGLPREIVKVCDLALIHAYSQQKKRVEREDVFSAAKELKIQQKH
jgi:type II secretory pathway predicted ATPase ExeA